MKPDIQKTLDELAACTDNRTTVFDIQISEIENGSLSLSGRLLDETQLTSLKDALALRFPDLSLNSASIKILNSGVILLMHVATNLTGLYERPTFGMPLASELTYGTPLNVLDEDGRWVFTRQTDGYLGWAYHPYLAEGGAPEATHLLLAPSVELRSEPDATSTVMTRVVSGTRVSAEETRGTWTCVAANKKGWVSSSWLRAVKDLPRSIEERRAAIVEDSARMIGVPYLWGGASGDGIDCSGLARLLHQWIGIDIPRDADMQYRAAKPIQPPFEIGDLFFFGEGDGNRHVTHVGVSLGGWKMIHSSRRQNGVYLDNVQEIESLREIYVSAGSFLR
jgi:gamma-D-glutamyl-L-lysine dipeptidyl-peptidase